MRGLTGRNELKDATTRLPLERGILMLRGYVRVRRCGHGSDRSMTYARRILISTWAVLAPKSPGPCPPEPVSGPRSALTETGSVVGTVRHLVRSWW